MAAKFGALKNEGAGFMRFCMVGALGFAADAGLLVLLMTHLGFGPITARIFSILFAVCVTWAANRVWTFRSRDSARVAEWSRYAMTSAAGASVNFMVYAALIETVPGILPVYALAVASAVALAVNYLGSRYFAFRQQTR